MGYIVNDFDLCLQVLWDRGLYISLAEIMTANYKQYLQGRQIDPRTWVKESHAPSLMKVNASSSSSALSDPYEIIEIESTQDIQPYCSFWRDSHDLVCEDVREWICATLNVSSEENEEYIVETMKALPEAISCNSLWTTGRKVPDVLLKIRESGLVQFEIDSGSKDTTIYKLIIGLIDQDRYARNFDTTITTTSGFYFPVGPGIPERVDVSWSDELLTYQAKCKQLAEENLDTELHDVIQHVLAQLSGLAAIRSSTCFTIPMTVAFLQTTFAADAFQLCSGASVVVMVPSQRKVYKHPLQASARDTLRMRVSIGELNFTAVPKSIATPNSLQQYFEYDQYFPPLSISEAKLHIVLFMKDVIAAIHELHGVGIAHLDIRLENICVRRDNDDYHPIFIDIDRSQLKSKRASFLYIKYSRTAMYKCGDSSWTCENLDWKQLGLLISLILDENEESRHDFVKVLINEGN